MSKPDEKLQARGGDMGRVVYLRDLDGTGSLHVCSKGDPGAIAHVPATDAPVRVKPLVWVDADDDDALARAESMGQEYSVGYDCGAWFAYSETWCGDVAAGLPTVDAAKAAAQADYEARILAALEPAPDLAELVEALEACVASLERADTAERVCCCGDSMDAHSDPMNCGHSPVDMGDYYAGKAREAARAALAKIKEPQT